MEPTQTSTQTPTQTQIHQPNRVDVPNPCIGVFDSGVGGLSVLAALRVRLPHVALCYIGDAAHAPYGERAPAEVIERCHHLVDQLVRRGARLVVVACNTATVIGIRALRERWPGMPSSASNPG